MPGPRWNLFNIATGSTRLLAVAPENPRFTLFGTARFNMPARSMVIDSNKVAYIITLSGLSVVPLTPNGVTTPQIATGARAIVSATDGSTNLRLAASSTSAGRIWPPQPLQANCPHRPCSADRCVTFNDVALPLLQTASGQIQAQIRLRLHLVPTWCKCARLLLGSRARL